MYKLGIYHGGFGSCSYEYVQPHIEWCKNNIDGHWTITPPHKIKTKYGIEFNLNYTFAFEEESDAMAFKLRWM